KVECKYHTLRKTNVYPERTSYVERIISNVISMNLVRLEIGDIGSMLVYLQLKPKLDNNKYVKNEFALPKKHKGNHTVENVLAPKPIEAIEVDDEEEERDDSDGLEHR
ncbi:hypothetical protein KI387_013723, partial [Taxus chinensis]